jgi:hypothetical protein
MASKAVPAWRGRPVGEDRSGLGKYALLWLLGIPLPILIIAYLIFH